MKVVYHLQGQTSWCKVLANVKQTSELGNFLFVEISSLYPKRLRKLETGIKDAIFSYRTQSFPFETFCSEKHLFRLFQRFWKFSARTTQKVVFHLHSNWIFWKHFAKNGKQPKCCWCYFLFEWVWSSWFNLIRPCTGPLYQASLAQYLIFPYNFSLCLYVYE